MCCIYLQGWASALFHGQDFLLDMQLNMIKLKLVILKAIHIHYYQISKFSQNFDLSA